MGNTVKREGRVIEASVALSTTAKHESRGNLIMEAGVGMSTVSSMKTNKVTREQLKQYIMTLIERYRGRA